LTNCTFTGNSSKNGGGMYSYSGSPDTNQLHLQWKLGSRQRRRDVHL